ncbi:rab effector Noc2 isoform X2 [Myotis myotis]|uniref:rab effector Noc2 isoform X2 n=1 Tax=Myotis myotis TaxID=51298 RepID=UPI001749AD99|nr:rab effector Noc2 isoform X2 [Myotis myotis]
MADTIFGSGSHQWVCPNDRQLALRAKLQTGWSVHTYQTEKQRKSQCLSPAEVEAILQVIQRAERLDVQEQQRVGRLVERLDTMRHNVMGNGLSQCLLCGEVLGYLGSSSVFCKDCRKKVCTKCGIEACPGQKRPLWLCKICSEQREVPSAAWQSPSAHPPRPRCPCLLLYLPAHIVQSCLQATKSLGLSPGCWCCWFSLFASAFPGCVGVWVCVLILKGSPCPPLALPAHHLHPGPGGPSAEPGSRASDELCPCDKGTIPRASHQSLRQSGRALAVWVPLPAPLRVRSLR